VMSGTYGRSHTPLISGRPSAVRGMSDCAAVEAVAASANTKTHDSSARVTARQHLSHVSAHVANLLGREHGAERRHRVAAGGHGLNRSLEIRDGDKRRAATVPALAVRVVTDDTGLFVQCLAG